MNDQWYDDNIEEPIRNIVKILRNNGFNTTCSCGHNMYVEGDVAMDGELLTLHKLLYDYYSELKEKPNYEINFTVKVCDGYIFQKYFYIKLNKNDEQVK